MKEKEKDKKDSLKFFNTLMTELRKYFDDLDESGVWSLPIIQFQLKQIKQIFSSELENYS